MSKRIAAFVDYENVRMGLRTHYQTDVPQHLPVDRLLKGIRQVAARKGDFYEGYVFGDWTLRPADARAIARTPQFCPFLVLRSDGMKDRTDAAMSFAMDEFFHAHADVEEVLVVSGDSDYCEAVRRGNRIGRKVHVCALAPQTSRELAALAASFSPLEDELGFSDYACTIAQDLPVIPEEAVVSKWAPLMLLLAREELRLPYVVLSYLAKKVVGSGLGLGDSFEGARCEMLEAVRAGILVMGEVWYPVEKRKVSTVRLARENPTVRAVLSSVAGMAGTTVADPSFVAQSTSDGKPRNGQLEIRQPTANYR